MLQEGSELWKDIFTVSMNEKFDLVYKQKMEVRASRSTFIYNISNRTLACSQYPDTIAQSPVCTHLFLAGQTLEVRPRGREGTWPEKLEKRV